MSFYSTYILHWVVFEPEVGSVFVWFVVAEDVITVYSPPSCKPLMKLLIHYALFRKLIVKFLLCRNLELCVHLLALIKMRFMVITMAMST